MAQPAAKINTSSFEKLILGFLVSLVLKGVLDKAYGATVGSATSSNLIDVAISPVTLSLLAFVLTLVRFVFGVYRVVEVAEDLKAKPPGLVIWDFFASVILFILFYFAALSILDARHFYGALIAVHVWDLVWFAVACALPSVDKRLDDAFRKFIFIDVVTVAGLLGIVYPVTIAGVDPWKAAVGATALMSAMAILDFYLNWRFFFPQPEVAAVPPAPAALPPGAPDDRVVYFAGPLFTQGEWKWNVALAEELERRRVVVLLPQRTAEPMLRGDQPFEPQKLYAENVAAINRSRAVVAVLDQADADSGTCWECGYAARAGIPIIGVRTDIRATGDDGGVNLMLSRSCAQLVTVPLANRTDIPAVATELVAALATVLAPKARAGDDPPRVGA